MIQPPLISSLKKKEKKILKKVINKRAIKDEGVEVLHRLQSANLGFILFFEREERSKSRVIITKRRKEKNKERNNNACMVMLFAPDHGYRDVMGVGEEGVRSEVYQCGSNLR